MMLRQSMWGVLGLVLVGCASAPSSDGVDTDERPDAVLLGVGVTPNDPVASLGEVVPFIAKAYYDDTSFEVITAEMSWVSTDNRVATVAPDGRATAVGEGRTDIIATSPEGVSTRIKLTVKGAGQTVDSVQLSPANMTLNVAERVEVTAIATYSDGSGGNIASRCTWSTDSAAVATVADAEVVAVAAGNTSVRADCGDGLVASASVTVRATAVVGQADLVISEAEAYGYDDSIEIYAIVENIGDASAGGFYIDAYRDRTSAPSVGLPSDGDVWVSNLAAGASRLVIIDLFDVAPGNYQTWLLADGDNTVAESNEANNAIGPLAVSISPQSRPDLVVTVFEGLSDGFDTLYEVTLRNIGDATARDFYVDLWVDLPGTPAVCDYGDLYLWVDALEPNQSRTWFPEIDDGPWAFWDSVVFVDSCDDVVESNETNNVSRLTLFAN